MGAEQIAWWRRARGMPQFVYVVQGPVAGPVKVGLTANPYSRLSDLRSERSEQLHFLCVVPGERRLESALHHWLRPARLTGEWFDGDLLVPFFNWVDEASRRAMIYFAERGEFFDFSTDLHEPKPQVKPTIRGYHKLGHRWRIADLEPRPVTRRFVDPATL